MMQCGSFFNFYDEDAEFVADQFNLKLYTLWGHKQCGIPVKSNIDKYINFFNQAGITYALIIQIKNEDMGEIYRVISESSVSKAIGLKVGITKKISKSKNKNEYNFLKAIAKGYNPLTGEVLDKTSAWKHPQIKDDIEEYFKTEDNGSSSVININNNSTGAVNEKTGVYSDGYYLKGEHFHNQKEWREALKKSEFTNAYEPWNADEDQKLISLAEKNSPENLSKLFNRSKGAIESRLKKIAEIHTKIKKSFKSPNEKESDSESPAEYVSSYNSKITSFTVNTDTPIYLKCYKCSHEESAYKVMSAENMLDKDNKQINTKLQYIKKVLHKLKCQKCSSPLLLLMPKKSIDKITYVATNSTSNNKFHKSSCGWMINVPAGSEIKFKSREDAIRTGFTPCHSCKP